MPENEPDFAALLQRLHEVGARFVLIGGLARKRAANRPKDQAHLYELLALKRLLAED